MSINKSNVLTQKIKHNLSAVEQKLLDMVIDKVDSKSEDLTNNEFIIDLTSYGDKNTNFKRLKDVLDLMPKKILRFIENDIKELNDNDKRKVKKMIDTKKITLIEILNFTEVTEIDLIFYLETLELSKSQKKELEKLKNKNEENIKQYNKKYKTIPLFASVVFLDASSFVKVEISKELMPYLVNYKKDYTGINTKDVFKLRSKYSIRLYELISSYQSLPRKKKDKQEHENYIEVSIPYLKLKEMLNLENKYKKRYDQFRNKVLETAKKELKEKETDFQFDYYIKGRGDYKYIIFKIYNVKEEKEKQEAKKKQELMNNSDDIDKQIYTNIEKELKKAGINKKIINSLIAEYDEMQIRRNIEYAYKRHNKDPKKNFAGYLINMIKNDFAMKTYEERQEYKKEKVKKQKGNSLPIEPKETETELELQKERLKNDTNLQQEFIKFIAEIAKEQPSGRASNILPELMLNINTIDKIAFIDKFIRKFLTKRGLNEWINTIRIL